MKVLKYFFHCEFFILCISFTNAVRNDKQFRPQNSVTRPPLIHRVRERLTSLIAHNHEHLMQHHHNYHQYVHQNHWSLLNHIYYTTPIGTSSTSHSSQEASSTTITDTTPKMPMTTTEFSRSPLLTSSETTTLSPRGNSEIVTLPQFLTFSSSSQSTMIFNTGVRTIPTQVTTTSSETTQSSKIPTSMTMSLTDRTTQSSTVETLKTTSLTESTKTMSSTEQKTESSSTSSMSIKSTEMSTTTKIPLKDPCDDRKTLYANGMALIRICYINESLTWFEARQKCLSISYRLFEINTYFKEISMFNYFKDFAVNNEFHWINGIAQDSTMSANWYVQDPYGVWNYTTNSWFGLVKAPVPGLCLGIIFASGMPKFTTKNCNIFHSTFWCEF